ncbi:Mbeg1-like protein [Bacillus sinesaloumensis]|uniref:Mbeg1-like protein n=1 Tax=Litchfieldia sinesaloumensis TaxID=1926280 RepID=UPI0009883F5D|nr:Mbeg1-like protein [Bacillus sinesaloumensis]
MSLSNLSEHEKYILLQLSYLDVPNSVGEISANSPHSVEDIMGYIDYDGLDPKAQLKYDAIDEYIRMNSNTPLKEIQLVGYQNNNPNGGNTDGDSYSGFVGYAFTDKQGNGTAIYRGSEDLKDVGHIATDWVSNVEAGIGITIQQQREANEFYERFIKGLDGQQYVFGHSKGGNLAEYVLVNNLEDESLTSYVVNGAPLYYWTLTMEQKRALEDRNTFIVHEGDFVSSLGYAPYVDKTVKLNSTDEGLMYAHGLDSVDFAPGGDFKNASDGASLVRDIANPIAGTIMLAASLHPKVLAYRAAAAIRDATLYILEAAEKGLEKAINWVKEETSKLINNVKELTKQVKAEINQFLADVASKAAILFVKVVAKMGGYFPVEPYLKVNVDRLYYYAQRLEKIKRRVSILNDRIDSLYWEVDFLDMRHVLKADILTSFSYRLNQNIDYLNTTARLLDSSETKLLSKARVIR